MRLLVLLLGPSVDLRTAAGRRAVDAVRGAVFFRRPVFLALGLIGEYIGRIYLEVRRRRPTSCARCMAPTPQRSQSAVRGKWTIRKLISERRGGGERCAMRAVRVPRDGSRVPGVADPMGAPVAALFTHRDAPDEEIWWRSCADWPARGIPGLFRDKIGADESRHSRARCGLLFHLFVLLSAPDCPKRVIALGASWRLQPAWIVAARNIAGRAPVNWVLVNGEREAGVTLHHMVARADAGDIVGSAQSRSTTATTR